MRNNLKLSWAMLFLILILSSQVAFSQGINSSELIKNAMQYDGKLVTYSGEAVGDVMSRGKFAWVNINDGDNAIGVWMSADFAREINFLGNYKSRGDKIEVIGVFHRACLEHGGDLDIHAQALRKLSNGRIVSQRLSIDKKNLTLILLGILMLIWILTSSRKK
jgi:hypothetical protein